MLRAAVILLICLSVAAGGYWLRYRSSGATAAAPEPQPASVRLDGLVAPFGKAPPETESLRDIYGDARSLSDFRGKKAVVLCFLGAHCPLSNRIVPQLRRLEPPWRDEGVQFIAVYANEGETVNEAAAHASDYDIPFAVLKDYGQKLADALGVERTPEFCVLDADGALVYRGRFSDQVAVGSTKGEAQRQDLDEAIRDAVAGQRVRVGETPADGCLLDRAKTGVALDPVNFVDDVAPLLQQHCEVCHRDGGMGPFALSSYDDAKQSAEMIREVTTQRRMPPWHADARYGEWKNDRHLSEVEIATLAAWVEQGTPPGDLARFKPRAWSSEWEIGEPDVVIEAEKSFTVPAEGIVPYQYIWADEKETAQVFAEDRWLVAAEVKPSAPAVVHHLMVMSVAPGFPGPQESYDGCSTAGSYLPGSPSLAFPPNTALKIAKGSRISFEMHYTPNGKETVDRPRVALKFSKTPPEREIRIVVLQTRKIEIPSGAPNHQMTMHALSPFDSEMLALLPHQHVRGKSFKFVAHSPDGSNEILLSVPRMDYYWQTFYWFKNPPTVLKDTQIDCVARWDNSTALLRNPDPQATVHWGPQSNDEMFVGWLIFVEKAKDKP